MLLVGQLGGRTWPWASAPLLTTALLTVAATALFARRQQRAPHPFFPVRLLRQRTLRIVTFLQFAAGLGMAAGIVYLTLDLQVVRGITPLQTGLHLLPLAVGLAGGSWLGRRLTRTGQPLRTSITVGAALSAVGLASFAALAAGPMPFLWAGMVVFGFGLGLGLGNEQLLVFSAAEPRDLGVAIMGVRFVETLGTSLGATVFAALFTALVPPHGVGPAVVHAINLIFLLGAVLLALSAGIASRLPRPQGMAEAPRTTR